MARWFLFVNRHGGQGALSGQVPDGGSPMTKYREFPRDTAGMFQNKAKPSKGKGKTSTKEAKTDARGRAPRVPHRPRGRNR